MACRRASLLSLMGGELASPCSGCDVCDGSAVAEAEGLAELRRFFAANRFRFGKAQSLRLLSEPAPGSAAMAGPGASRRSPGEPPACPGGGFYRPGKRRRWKPCSPAPWLRGYYSRVHGCTGEKDLVWPVPAGAFTLEV
jgi:hypothetical protein